MNDFTMPLLLDLDVVSLTMSLVNIPSATGAAGGLADSIEEALTPVAHLSVERIGDTVVVRTLQRGDAAERVLVAGRIDTVGGDSESFAYVEMGKLFGTGACDPKGGLAVLLKAATATYDRDVTYVLYDGAEGDLRHGLTALADTRPDLLAVDLAVLLEPTAASWSDVATLASSGIPTAAFGPGDPSLAHSPDEFVPTAELTQCEHVLRTWLAN